MKEIILIFSCWLSAICGFAQANFQEMTTGQSRFLLESAWGVAVADYDNDGDDDFYVCSQSGINGNRLYKNNGDFFFTEVSHEAGLDLSDNSRVAIWLDVENDGWLDILIGSSSKLRLFKNQRNGSFQEVTTGGFPMASSPNGILVGDLNGDQWPDIYCNNFLSSNQLLFNLGNGQFKDGIIGSGAESAKNSMSGILFDYDKDGDLDIYLIFDGDRNTLFQNNGSGKFSDVTVSKHLDLHVNGMGVDIGDFNKDGNYDLYVTNFFDNALLIKQSDGTYSNQAVAAGVNDHGMAWGTVSFDYNNDALTDVYIANEYGSLPYTNKLYKNNGNNTFTDQGAGTVLEIKKNGHGCAYSDFDLDGKLDLVVVNSDQGVNLLKNSESTGNWIKLNLVGKTTNKFGIGAHVEVKLGQDLLMDDVTVGSSYVSQNSVTLQFGLGSATQVDSITVRWLDGKIDKFSNVTANKRYLIVENSSLEVFTVPSYQQALAGPSLMPAPAPAPPDAVPGLPGQSVARRWNEALLNAIRADLARPNVHARNLFHTSIALYDAWAAYDDKASPFLLNNTINGFTTPFTGVPIPVNLKSAREEAMSYAAFRLLNYRFRNSPGASQSATIFQSLFNLLGYDASVTSTDYTSGKPAALGNYIASKIIEFGLQDGSNEIANYANQFYKPVNSPLRPDMPGVSLIDANRWQPLKLITSIDQNGNQVSSLQTFLGAEWGRVTPFALSKDNLTKLVRGGKEFWTYYDPGPPPLLDTLTGGGTSNEYKWNYALVAQWASHLGTADNVKIDISPATIGNIDPAAYPTNLVGLHSFYKEEGGDIGRGYSINPKTNLPYQPQLVLRGDFGRVLAEFWADGPKSETPPGHWFTILNYVNDQPGVQKKLQGSGPILENLEWDVKSYLMMGGAVHDAAISCWGTKGFYDGVRPISAIRYLAKKGQSTSKDSVNYDVAGIQLKKGFVELVKPNDPLAGLNNENVGKIKLYTWKGPAYISDPKIDVAGVGWILAENWVPYQKATFVTPPFAGYISGHSTYSSAGAEILTLLTGDEYFPGGLGQFSAPKDSYLTFEKGPSVDVTLQWARYKDAADQSALSRIWGGIHPPADDIPGRLIGKKIGQAAFQMALSYFYKPVTEVEKTYSLQVFPNPLPKGTPLKIALKESEKIHLLFFDMLGRKVHQTEVIGTNSSSTMELDLSFLPAGFYILKVMRDHNSYSTKIIID